MYLLSGLLVPEAGLEPAWYCYRRILSPLRLPVSPLGHCSYIIANNPLFCKTFLHYLPLYFSPFPRPKKWAGPISAKSSHSILYDLHAKDDRVSLLAIFAEKFYEPATISAICASLILSSRTIASKTIRCLSRACVIWSLSWKLLGDCGIPANRLASSNVSSAGSLPK